MITDNPPQKRNTLTIRLTEPVVFLNAGSNRGRQQQNGDLGPPSMLRGLLTLNIAKPTRIASIEIEIQGKTRCAWREGVGPRSIEVTEERKLFTASTVFFRADSASKHRRTASVGPGLTSHDISDNWMDDTTTGEYDDDDDDILTLRSGSSFGARRGRRTLSVDSTTHQSNYLSHQEERLSRPTPPYPSPNASALPSTSSLTARSLSSSSSRGSAEFRDQSPAQSLSDFRNALNAGTVTRSSSRHSLLSLSLDDTIPARSSTLTIPTSAGLPHNPIVGNVPEDSAVSVDTSRPRHPSSPPSYRNHFSSSAISGYPSPPPSPIRPRSSSRTPPSSTSERGRPRGTSRLRFGSILDAFKDVGSKSPQRYMGDAEDKSDLNEERGRTMAKSRVVEGENVTEPTRGREEMKNGRGRSALGKFSGLLGLDGEENKETGDGWKEFKPGVYTYPISFAIPGDSPPSLTCTSGSVSWRLKAEVHRPGVLTSKISATRDVILVSMPGEDDSEETGHIHFDQLWESQLQYVISVAGKSFPIGGLMPIRFTLRPLAKIKIYRITVLLEERIEYHTLSNSIARTDPYHAIVLLFLKYPSKDGEGEPLFPMASSFENSPLYTLLTSDDDPLHLAATFEGPGPWTFHHNLRIPASCSHLHFTIRNPACNITITHSLKVILRVQKGDDHSVDPKTGKPKLYDIVVAKPVHILSCRGNWEWTALPHYSESFAGHTTSESCPCTSQRPALVGASAERGLHSIRNSGSTIGLRRSPHDSLYEQNTQFERLVSGQESEVGEAPPSYNSATTTR